MPKIIFIEDHSSKTITEADMPVIPRVGEKIWIDIEGGNPNRFTVEEVEYDFSVNYDSNGRPAFIRDKVIETRFTHVSVILKLET